SVSVTGTSCDPSGAVPIASTGASTPIPSMRSRWGTPASNGETVGVALIVGPAAGDAAARGAGSPPPRPMTKATTAAAATRTVAAAAKTTLRRNTGYESEPRGRCLARRNRFLRVCFPWISGFGGLLAVRCLHFPGDPLLHFAFSDFVVQGEPAGLRGDGVAVIEVVGAVVDAVF